MAATTPHPNIWTKTAPSYNSEFMRFPSRRSQVMGTKGVVACSQPLAASAGIEILNRGGNAADAAVAVAAALNVTEPCSTGIGGDAFCLFYDAKNRKVRALNGSGRSPKAMTLKKLRDAGITGSTIPHNSIHSVTVPGAAAAWVDTVQLLGSGKPDVSLSDVLAPAIRLAEDGYCVHEIAAHSWKSAETQLQNASPNGGDMLLNGKAPAAGDVMRLPFLAQTFREVGKSGKDGFYRGRIAEAIVELIQSKGGLMELEDLAQHADVGTEEVNPISYTYGGDAENGVTVYECPPNGQGLTALMALGILDELQASGKCPVLETLEHNSAAYLHILVEALRFAFAETRYYVSDPAHGNVPVSELLSKPYLRQLASKFDANHTSPVKHGKPVSSSDTTYFSVVDSHGNACSFINSNYAGFGTGALPKHCGFTLQNRGSAFVLQEGHPNCVSPSKRPYHTIIPALALRGDQLFLSYGVMGGFMQPQGHVQVLLNMLRGYGAQASLDAPRFCIGTGTPDAGDADVTVYLEDGIHPAVVKSLIEKGHPIRTAQSWDRSIFGRGQIIQQLSVDDRRSNVAWAAGSDLRGDGQVIAQV